MKLLRAMGLIWLALILNGCEAARQVAPNLGPAVVDVRQAACPSADSRDRAEARRTTPRPAPDGQDATGRPAFSRDKIYAWIDRLEISERRKNAALIRGIMAQDACSGAARAGT